MSQIVENSKSDGVAAEGPQTQKGTQQGSPFLVARNLQVRYRNGALGVSDVSLEVGRGSVVALFGANGAGKTTTVRAISGFLRSEGARVVRGEVVVDGVVVTNVEPMRTSALGVAFVPERRKIFPSLSVVENLNALGRRPPRGRRGEALARIYELFPMLAGRSRELAGRLSGGQQQMLAIARSLMSDARLVILDEMTLGLHHSMHGPLFEIVRKIASEGTAVIMVDESVGMALRVADFCYVLSDGVVAASGPPSVFANDLLRTAGFVES